MRSHKRIIEKYMNGRCHVMALAIQRLFGGRIIGLIHKYVAHPKDPDNKSVAGKWAVWHVYCDTPQGAIDIRGMHLDGEAASNAPCDDAIQDMEEEHEDCADDYANGRGVRNWTEPIQCLQAPLWEYGSDWVPLSAYTEADVVKAMADFVRVHPTVEVKAADWSK